MAAQTDKRSEIKDHSFHSFHSFHVYKAVIFAIVTRARLTSLLFSCVNRSRSAAVPFSDLYDFRCARASGNTGARFVIRPAAIKTFRSAAITCLPAYDMMIMRLCFKTLCDRKVSRSGYLIDFPCFHRVVQCVNRASKQTVNYIRAVNERSLLIDEVPAHLLMNLSSSFTRLHS